MTISHETEGPADAGLFIQMKGPGIFLWMRGRDSYIYVPPPPIWQVTSQYMRALFFICLLLFTACVTSKNIYRVAKKTHLVVRKVEGINLSGGNIKIDTLLGSSKEEPIYLLYSGDTLKYLSTDRSMAHGEFMYAVKKIGDSIYQLTRSSNFPRYFFEDTVLFHHNYVVTNRYLYDGTAANRGNFVQAEFYSYHFTADSLVEFSWDSFSPTVSVFEYGSNVSFTENFIKQSRQWKMPKYREEDLIRHILP